jgi:hypothetical protein
MVIRFIQTINGKNSAHSESNSDRLLRISIGRSSEPPIASGTERATGIEPATSSLGILYRISCFLLLLQELNHHPLLLNPSSELQ